MPYHGDAREFECDFPRCGKTAGVTEAHSTGWFQSKDGKAACPNPEHQSWVKTKAFDMGPHYKSHHLDQQRRNL